LARLTERRPQPNDDVVLIDERDRQTGSGPKLRVHQQGLLHRAFSVFLVHPDGSWLLQQRAAGKYHSPLRWANACCGHPRPGETVEAGAARRLAEELGITVPLRAVGSLVYRATLEGGLVEHEYDHLLAGTFDGECAPDPNEVAAVRWVAPAELRKEVAERPELFAVWFLAILRGEATGAGIARLIAGERLLD
jgi:isopentenyl-diphosphate delta-isomerase